MSEMLALFACCRDPVVPAQAFCAPVGEEPVLTMVGAATGVVVPLVRALDSAVHEAGHAVVGVAVGGTSLGVSIEGQPTSQIAPGLGDDAFVAMVMAGPVADAWARSEIAAMTDGELALWTDAIRALRGGSCDRCKAVRNVVVTCNRAAGVDVWASDEIVIPEYRRLERLTGNIVRLPMVWSAIEEIADALKKRGRLTGDEVHDTCSRHFQRGFIFETVE